MFTGIIEEVGTILRIKNGIHSAILEIGANTVLGDIHIGDSIAVNGVCLTVVAFDKKGFQADVMHETLDRSSLAALRSGSHVNLERALLANGRLGGHIVAGHVDGTGRIMEIRRDDTAIWYRIQADSSLLRYVVEKGSIAIDGISLTVSVIPHTAAVTILTEKKPGDLVNLENDMIGKYVEKLLMPPEPEAKKSGITEEFLKKYGF